VCVCVCLCVYVCVYAYVCACADTCYYNIFSIYENKFCYSYMRIYCDISIAKFQTYGPVYVSFCRGCTHNHNHNHNYVIVMIKHVSSINEYTSCYEHVKIYFHSSKAYGSVYISFANDAHTITTTITIT